MATIAILHPGAMGAEVGSALLAVGHDVVWASSGRSASTSGRAGAAGLRDVRTIEAALEAADVVLSICPPDVAVEVARHSAGLRGVFVDANAIAPQTAERIAAIIGDGYVDGGIIGGPPARAGTTRLYLSGPDATDVAALFAGARIEARIVDGPFAASTLKMIYAAWTKGSQALLLATERAAQAGGVAEQLHTEWALSQPQLAERLAAASRAGAEKGWRWAGEMREIAATFAALGEPDGFHRAAAEVFDAHPRPAGDHPSSAARASGDA